MGNQLTFFSYGYFHDFPTCVSSDRQSLLYLHALPSFQTHHIHVQNSFFSIQNLAWILYFSPAMFDTPLRLSYLDAAYDIE